MHLFKMYSNIFSIYFRTYSFKEYLRAHIHGNFYPSFGHLAFERPFYIWILFYEAKPMYIPL